MIVPLSILAAVLFAPFGAQPTSDGPNAAIDAVTSRFVPNPMIHLRSTGKPVESSGTWKVEVATASEWPAVCRRPDAKCVKVTYHFPQENIDCSWTVALVRGSRPVPDGKLIDGVISLVVDENDSAAKYMLKTSWIGGEAPFRATMQVLPDPALIPASAPATARVTVQVVVDPEGLVSTVLPLDGQETLMPSAVAAAKRWKFEPLKIGSHYSSFQTKITFTRSPSGTTADYGGRQRELQLVGPSSQVQR